MLQRTMSNYFHQTSNHHSLLQIWSLLFLFYRSMWVSLWLLGRSGMLQWEQSFPLELMWPEKMWELRISDLSIRILSFCRSLVSIRALAHAWVRPGVYPCDRECRWKSTGGWQKPNSESQLFQPVILISFSSEFCQFCIHQHFPIIYLPNLQKFIRRL